MIAILHGYLLDGSGSNLWTRSIVRALCAQGQTVHLFCQESDPEAYPFVAEAVLHTVDRAERLFERNTEFPGRCIVHKPEIGDTLPVYVWDQYDEFDHVVPLVELPDEDVEAYLFHNAAVVARVVREAGIRVLHANHIVLMPVVAQRVQVLTGVPFAMMPHGSALEYAVKRDPRYFRYASEAIEAAARIFVIGDEMRQRVLSLFAGSSGIEEKMQELHLGVDTAAFDLVPRQGRRARIERLAEQLRTLEPGKRPEQSAQLRTAVLAGAVGPQELAHSIAAGTGYATKAPDADAADKLLAVDWRHERVLLFVGRLIAAKGPQAVIAALPLILDRTPNARLIVVGHGPLRETLEALLLALQAGQREVVRTIAAFGRGFESAAEAATDTVAEPVPLPELHAFLQRLEAAGEDAGYFEAARRQRVAERVTFTGYLSHGELRHVFPCCDVAVFPSVVAEAGPLVFLEALASGCFPLGTYFAGMAASIDAAAVALPEADAEMMKLRPDAAHVAADIAERVPRALELGERHREALRRIAVEHYDWSSVARRLARSLHEIADRTPAGPGAPTSN
ncbi:MAG: glycosyltransferase [Longimicrobiales bacterium]